MSKLKLVNTGKVVILFDYLFDNRLGHSKTVENVMKMLVDEGSLKGVSVCDAGCGTGCLSIPLAKEGANVYASDISAAMVAEAQKQVICLLKFV